MDALKAAIWVSKIEDRRDALRLRFHTMGVKALLNQDEQESIKPPRLTLATLPLYLKEKGLSGLLYVASTPAIFASWFKPKSIIGSLLLVFFVLTIISLLTVALVSGGMYYYLSGPVDEQQLQHYLKQHRQSIAISLHDKNDHLIGALPPLASDYDNEIGALYVKTVPPLYWELIKAPNDKTLSFQQNKPSFWSLYKNIIQFKDAFYKGVNLSAPYQLGQHNDALIMRIAKGLQGGVGNNRQDFMDRLFKSKETLRVARHLYPYLAQNKGEEFKRWSAMHAPLLSANNDVYGLTAIAATLFGKTAEHLSAGQQAVLATAYHQQTKMAYLFSPKSKQRQKTWERLLKNTEIAVTRYFQFSQPQTLRRILKDLKAMQLAPTMSISSQWLTFIEKQHGQVQVRPLYQHLLKRSALTLGKIKSSLHQNLQQMVTGLEKGTIVTDVKISLPIFQNQQLDDTLGTAFSTIHRFYPNLFSKQLGESVKKNGAVIRLQVANEEGNIIRSYQRGEMKKRPIAGLSTLAVGSLLLSLNDYPKTRYCNKSYAGIRNASEPIREGIGSCKALNRKGHSFSLQQSIYEDKALPLLYALTQTHKVLPTALIKLYKDFSLSKQGLTHTTSNANKLAYELSLGNVASSPKDVHRIIHALTRHLYGIPYDNNPGMIELLQMNRLVSVGGQQKIEYSSRGGGSSHTNMLEEYLSDQSSRNDMKLLFNIPLTKKKNPLKFLRSVEKKYGVDFLLIKSATLKISGNKTKDKWLVGSVRLKQHIYSFMIMIGSDDSIGLGKNISHQQLMLPVVNAMIESLQQ